MQAEHEQRRWRLLSLVQGHFGRDNDLVAQVIQRKTGERVSERSVQAWLIAPGRKSSRNVPEWAVKALEDYVADPANREYLEDYAARREATLGAMQPPLVWSNEVRSSRSVELATASLEAEARRQRVWQDACGVQVGDMVFGLERELHAEMRAHRRTLSAINEAFRTSSTYEECKATFQEHVRASDLEDFFVREAKRAIESGAEEFSTPDAVIQQPPSTEAR